MCHFYPRSPCGERHSLERVTSFLCCISIHALLAESDGSRQTHSEFLKIFLSTLSLRRATQALYNQDIRSRISIHALLAESDLLKLSSSISKIKISIHALLAESDHRRAESGHSHHHFYPRSPCGERPTVCDSRLFFSNFYPRSPCGERLVWSGFRYAVFIFLSTLSLRRATSHCRKSSMPSAFLSTLSLRRATACTCNIPHKIAVFLSTLSLRRATQMVPIAQPSKVFLSTLSLRRAT